MLYEETLKQPMLGILDDRVSGIASCITDLASKGFAPNKKKLDTLSWSILLYHAYENIDVFTREQQDNLDIIYNNVIRQ